MGDVAEVKLRDVAGLLRSGEMELNVLLVHKEMPSLLGHTLACDCAMYALDQEEARGASIDDGLYAGLKVKRLWTEGEMSLQACEQAHKKAGEIAMGLWQERHELRTRRDQEAAAEAARLQASWEAARIVRDALHPTLSQALWAVRGASTAWQTQRLVWLCEVWDACGDRTPFLMREGSFPLPAPDDASISNVWERPLPDVSETPEERGSVACGD